MRSLFVTFAVAGSECGNMHLAPKIITANDGKQAAITCSGGINVSGNQPDG